MLVATSATQGYDLFDTVKVHAVEMWATGANQSTQVTVSCGFAGGVSGAAGDGKIWSDTSLGTTGIAHIKAKPSPASAAGQWQGSGAFVAFTLFDVPAGAIIDVDVSFRNVDVAPVAAAVALVAATAGQFYYRGLDGQAIAGTKFSPIGEHLTI